MSIDSIIVTHLEALDGDFVVAVEADKLVTKLEEVCPGSLDQWLHDNSRQFIAVVMRDWLNAERNKAKRRAKARAFGTAAAAVHAGDPDALGHFTNFCVVSEDNVRRLVGDMTGADHRFVASGYQARGREALQVAAFHEAVARKVGKNRTADVFTEEQYDALLASMTRAQAA